MQPNPQDFIAILEQQRNDALNQLVNCAAALAAMARERDAFKAEVERLNETPQP